MDEILAQMKELLLAILLLLSIATFAQKRHYSYQGGHYKGGKGSSHKGGHYINIRTGGFKAP